MNADFDAAASRSSRLFFLDHLRVFLVTLVVVHHVALVCAAGAPDRHGRTSP